MTNKRQHSSVATVDPALWIYTIYSISKGLCCLSCQLLGHGTDSQPTTTNIKTKIPKETEF